MAVLTRLRHADPSERIAASRALLDISAAAGPSVAELVPLLGDEFWDVRSNVARVIVDVGGDAATPHLRKALRGDEYQRQMGALGCLRDIGPAAAAASPEVAELLRRGHEDVVALAVQTLDRIDQKALLDGVRAALAEADDPISSPRTRALLRHTANRGTHARPVVEPYARRLLEAEAREHVVFGIELLEKIGSVGRGREAFAKLLEPDMDANGKWFGETVRDQGKQGCWAVPHLARILGEAEDQWTVATACTALESIGTPAALPLPPASGRWTACSRSWPTPPTGAGTGPWICPSGREATCIAKTTRCSFPPATTGNPRARASICPMAVPGSGAFPDRPPHRRCPKAPACKAG
jgi:hypothetical protein